MYGFLFAFVFIPGLASFDPICTVRSALYTHIHAYTIISYIVSTGGLANSSFHMARAQSALDWDPRSPIHMVLLLIQGILLLLPCIHQAPPIPIMPSDPVKYCTYQ